MAHKFISPRIIEHTFNQKIHHTSSNSECPVCKRMLAHEIVVGIHWIFCSNPNCESVAANAGGKGDSYDAALDDFRSRLA